MSATEPDQESVGAILRAAREARGMSHAKVAEQLRLAVATIAALEQDRFDELGPQVFARGHLRKYAALVGADADRVLAAHARRYSGSAESTLIPPASAHKPVGTASRWRLPALLAGGILLAGVLAAAGWWAWQQYAPIGQPAAPTANAPTANAPAGPVASPTLPAGDEVAPAVEDIGPAAPGPDDAGEAVPEPTSAIQPSPSTAAVPTTTAPATVGRWLRLEFSDACWLEVYDANGRRLAYDLVAAGETRSFPGPAPWRLVLGNARAVRLSLDGNELRLPGALVVQNTASIRIGESGSIERVDLPPRQVS